MSKYNKSLVDNLSKDDKVLSIDDYKLLTEQLRFRIADLESVILPVKNEFSIYDIVKMRQVVDILTKFLNKPDDDDCSRLSLTVYKGGSWDVTLYVSENLRFDTVRLHYEE